MMKQDGLTLIELLVVITIVGILIAAGAFEYTGWQGRYNVESEIQQLHADLMAARSRAMQYGKYYFFQLPSATEYAFYEDDGNWSFDPAVDAKISAISGTVQYGITWGGGVVSFDTKGIIRDKSGEPLQEKAICLFTDRNGDGVSDFNPDLDCLLISATRIIAGQLNTQNPGNCDDTHCIPK